MQNVKTSLFVLICALLLGSCGHKGPLYLPDETTQAQAAAQEQKEPGSEEEKEKKPEEDIDAKRSDRG
jgi:predicted small lipoprotein YifL